MEAEQRIQALEQEVQILKTQIQSILLDIQSHLLTNAYPTLRSHHTNGSSAEDEEDDDEYDRAAAAPKVRKVSVNANASAKHEKPLPPVRPAEPMMASLDEQQQWVLQNIQSSGISRTRELIEEYTQARRISPEVSDTLMRFTDIYAAAAEEPTLPTRPAGMPTGPVTVKAVTTAPTKPPTQPRAPQRSVPAAPVSEPVKPAPKAVKVTPKAPAPAKPAAVEQPQPPVPAKAKDAPEQNDTSNVVLRLIAGVQNAGAGVRWGKNKD